VGQQKAPTPGTGIGAKKHPFPFSGIFNVARNPVTKRHGFGIERPKQGVKQSSGCRGFLTTDQNQFQKLTNSRGQRRKKD
jgi:hypothetical protein